MYSWESLKSELGIRGHWGQSSGEMMLSVLQNGECQVHMCNWNIFYSEIRIWHLWPNNCRFTDSCWELVIIFMLNLHKPEVVIDILQIDVALPDLSKCQFNWTWNIYSKSNILKLIDTFVPWNQIFQYLVCNQYQHLCIYRWCIFSNLILNQMPISQHCGIIPWELHSS